MHAPLRRPLSPPVLSAIAPAAVRALHRALWGAAFAAGLAAQEQSLPARAKPVPDAKVEVLRQILDAATDGTYRFATELKCESPFTRATGQNGVKRTQGVQASGCLYVDLPDKAGELLRGGRRSLVRSKEGDKDGKWLRRAERDADGVVLPFLFDPELFFPAVLDAKLQWARADVGTLDDRPVEVVSAHVEGEAAHALAFSGALPTGDEMTNTLVVRMGGVGGRVLPQMGELEVDLAFFIDPASKRLLRVKTVAYGKSPMMGGFVLAAGGAQPEEEEEPDDEDEKAPLRYENGLPVRHRRAKDGWVTSRYQVTLSEHDAAKIEALDDAARAALGLRAK